MKTTASRGMTTGEVHNSFNALLESVREAVFVIESNTGRLLEANQPAASMLGYSRAELLTLQADRIFVLGTALFHQLTSASRTSSLSDVQCVTKQGQRVSCALRAHAVEHCRRAAVLVAAYDAEAIPALAPSHQVSEMSTGVGERPEEYEEVIETTFAFPSIVGQGEQIRGVCRLIGLGCADQHHRLDPGRERHRQRTGRSGHPFSQLPQRPALNQSQLCSTDRNPARKRIVRPQEGSVYRRDSRPERTFQVSRWGDNHPR
jgi:PAS domain S-box-containing protein